MTSRIWDNRAPTRRRSKKLGAYARLPAMTDGEASALAKKWFGEHGTAEKCDEVGLDFYAVGWWGVDPFGKPGDPMDYYYCQGTGESWAVAFRDADPKLWQAYRIAARAKSAAQRRP